MAEKPTNSIWNAFRKSEAIFSTTRSPWDSGYSGSGADLDPSELDNSADSAMGYGGGYGGDYADDVTTSTASSWDKWNPWDTDVKDPTSTTSSWWSNVFKPLHGLEASTEDSWKSQMFDEERKALMAPLDDFLKKPFDDFLKKPFDDFLKKPFDDFLNKPMSSPFEDFLQKPMSSSFDDFLKKPFDDFLKKPMTSPVDDFLNKRIDDFLKKPMSSSWDSDLDAPMTSLSDFRDDPEPASTVTVMMHMFEVYLVPGKDAMSMWRCAGVALLLVLATLLLLALVWLVVRRCCCPKPSGSCIMEPIPLEAEDRYELPPCGWADKQTCVKLMDPRLLDLYTKPGMDEHDPRMLEAV